MEVRRATANEEEVSQQLVQLLATPTEERKSEDVFEIANGLYRASFVRQLSVATRSAIARCALLYDIVPGAHVYLSEKSENALYIVLSGGLKIEAAGLEFLLGDTFGFRPTTCPTWQVMAEHRVVTCSKRGVAVMVSFEHCLEIWPEPGHGKNGSSLARQSHLPLSIESTPDLVWSPALAKSILFRGSARDEEVLVALEFLNFPPINGYSKELREILVSQFVMRREEKGGVFVEWINHIPIDPSDVRLSRVYLTSVVMVVSGALKATCRRRKRKSSLDTKVAPVPGSDTPKDTSAGEEDRGDDGNDGDDGFVMMRLKAGEVFPPESGKMQGGRHRKDERDFDQEVGEDWADFTLCALIAESPSAEVLLVEETIFNDVIYPGADLRYSMERVRDILGKPPGVRTSREITYIARNVLSHHVAFQQTSSLALERIASRLTDTVVARAGEVLVEHGEKVASFVLLLTGSASIVSSSKAKARSQMRRVKVGRLEPGDLWGTQHMHAGSNAEVEIVAVETCEVIRCRMDLVRAAEKRDPTCRSVSAKAMHSLTVPPEQRRRPDVRHIIAEMSTPKSALDVARFRDIPACLKTRIAAALRLEVWPPFRELLRNVDGASNYLVIVKGSISLQVTQKSQRFNMETLDIPERSLLKNLDVDNGLALEDWRASGLGPCAAMLYERQVLGEYPNPQETILSARAVTRQETTAAVVDPDLYDKQLSQINPSDMHAAVCREVLAHLKRSPDNQAGIGSLDSDLLLRLQGANRALKRLSTTCRLRLSGAIALKRYSPGEVVTEAEDFGDNLFIVLEGRLEYSIQDVHRGVIDRALAKEAGIVPGLRCVGLMTSGDFFAPDSMIGSDRRPRIVRAGSYRIRCSPDKSVGGAMCLVLPRQKLEDAVKRDRYIRSVFAHNNILRLVGRSEEGAVHIQTPGSLPKVNFGGPELPEFLSPSTSATAAEGREAFDLPRVVPIVVSPPPGGGTAENEAGSSCLVTSRARTKTTPTLPPTQEQLPGPTFVYGNGEQLIAGEPQQRLRASGSFPHCLHSRRRERTPTPPEASAAAIDTATAVAARGPQGFYPETPPATGNTVATVTTVVEQLSDAVRTRKRQVFMTGVPSRRAHEPGSDGDTGKIDPHSSTTGIAARSNDDVGRLAVGGGSSVVEVTVRTGARGDRCDNTLTVVDQPILDALRYVHDGHKIVGEFLEGSGDEQSVARDSLGWEGRCTPGGGGDDQSLQTYQYSVETAHGSVISSRVVDAGATRIRARTEMVDCDNLLNVLRSFVHLHVDPNKDYRRPQTSPRAGFSGRLADDELTLLRMLSEICRAPSRDDRQDASVEAEQVLRPTPLCCRQALPPATLNGGDLGSGGGGTTILASVRQAIARDARRARAAMTQRAMASSDADNEEIALWDQGHDQVRRQRVRELQRPAFAVPGGATSKQMKTEATVPTPSKAGNNQSEYYDRAVGRRRGRSERDGRTPVSIQRSFSVESRPWRASVHHTADDGRGTASSYSRSRCDHDQRRECIRVGRRTAPQQPSMRRSGTKTPLRRQVREERPKVSANRGRLPTTFDPGIHSGGGETTIGDRYFDASDAKTPATEPSKQPMTSRSEGDKPLCEAPSERNHQPREAAAGVQDARGFSISRICIDKRRTCTGAPSHEEQVLLGSGGARSGIKHAEKAYSCGSRALQVLPGVFGRGEEARVPGVVKFDEDKNKPTAVIAGRPCKSGVPCRYAAEGGRGGSPPKQPAVVRRLKMTLQELNDL